ncbi:hypothetical protein [Streptomyces tibetensis]
MPSPNGMDVPYTHLAKVVAEAGGATEGTGRYECGREQALWAEEQFTCRT